MNKLFGISLLGVAIGTCLLLVGILFPVLVPIGSFVICFSFIAMFLIFIIEAALFCLSQ